jgi:hypothetical protein
VVYLGSMGITVAVSDELISRIRVEADQRDISVEDATIELLNERLHPRHEVLVESYREVCRSHEAITDFRARLLAFLPIASGAAAGLAVFASESSDRYGWLIALGVFGAIVTFGLLMYELRQIDLCKQLINHGAWIEARLGVTAGQFGGRRHHLKFRDVYWPASHHLRNDLLRSEELMGRQHEKDYRGELDRHGLIGVETAGYIVYHVVIMAWIGLVAFGIIRLLAGDS